MSNITRFLALCREYLFPAGCPICGKTLLNTQEAWYGLCAACMPLFELDNEERCDSCGRPLISERNRCLSCRNGEKRAFDGAWALYPYTGKYRRLLRAYKFGQSRALGHFFAEKMTQELARFLARIGETALEAPHWIPVPPRPGKIRRVGWDQAAHLAGLLRGAPVCRCLKRLPSQSQKELNRESRMRNLQGRIIHVRKPPAEAILFDDVITTGATLDACAAALKSGGAQKVYALCLFYD